MKILPDHIQQFTIIGNGRRKSWLPKFFSSLLRTDYISPTKSAMRSKDELGI